MAPSTKMRAGPSPCSSKAIVVPSFDLSVFTLVSFKSACGDLHARTDDARHQKSSVASAPSGELAPVGVSHRLGGEGEHARVTAAFNEILALSRAARSPWPSPAPVAVRPSLAPW